jgi:hypothetical protein
VTDTAATRKAYNEFMMGPAREAPPISKTRSGAPRTSIQSVERDPDFALAHATLSFVSMNIHFQFDPQRTWLQQADNHCRRALALRPDTT